MVICFAEKPYRITKSFLPIPGGKWYLSHYLLKMIPPHEVYVEVFGGGAVLLLRKPPSPAEVYNDIDGDLVNLFRMVRDEEKFRQFNELVYWTLYSREEFNLAREKLKKREELSDVERAYYFFLTIQQSFGGKGAPWGYRVKSLKNLAKTWFNRKKILGAIHQRLANVQIEHDDFRNIIRRYDTPETFFYLDPPYYPGTYSTHTLKSSLSEKDYEDLFNLLLGIKGKALLSGYYHPAYKVLEDAGWKRIDIKRKITLLNTNKTGGWMPNKVESLWFNYELPQVKEVIESENQI
jgi:DNA adenine methylase